MRNNWSGWVCLYESKSLVGPGAAQWGRVNKILGEYLLESTRLKGCDVSFQEVFSLARQDAYFPVLFNLLRLVPGGEPDGRACVPPGWNSDGTL